ncbi:MAG: hypothetical protein V3S55_07715 [Nitrospiraceae bacterium]
MTRMIQILERCITKLEEILVIDPMRPGTKYIATSGLPDKLDQIRGDLEFLRDMLEKENQSE